MQVRSLFRAPSQSTSYNSSPIGGKNPGGLLGGRRMTALWIDHIEGGSTASFGRGILPLNIMHQVTWIVFFCKTRKNETLSFKGFLKVYSSSFFQAHCVESTASIILSRVIDCHGGICLLALNFLDNLPIHQVAGALEHIHCPQRGSKRNI